ncbi:MAG: hypothetical protein ABIB47_03940 [Candidatus Woesearchaeota archaeon]
MISNKRGAVELSITTIVVVVIGITLLTLGLIWVNNIFDRLSGTTGGAFEKADAQIENILGAGSDESPYRLVPGTVTLKPGDSTRVVAVFSNSFEGDISGVTVTVASVDSTKVNCEAGDRGGTSSKSYMVKSATALKIPIFVKVDKNSGVGDYLCRITSPGDFGGHVSSGTVELLTVKVRK